MSGDWTTTEDYKAHGRELPEGLRRQRERAYQESRRQGLRRVVQRNRGLRAKCLQRIEE